MKTTDRWKVVASVWGAVWCAGAVMAQEAAPKGQPLVPPADPTKTMTVTTTAVSAPAGAIVTADDLLGALELAGKDLRTLQADLRWTKQFGEITGGDEKQIRIGKLLFESQALATGLSADAKPLRRFQVDFTTEIVDNEQRTKRTVYVFDGQWFVERQPDQKQVFRRQVVPPGQTIDPLAVGEGPFPVPIGQQRAKILERFVAENLPAGDDFAEGKAPQSLQDTYQLKLTPRPGTDEAKQFQQVRIWYRKTDLLPRLARTTDRDGSKTEVFLTAMELNKPLPEQAFDTTRPAGWSGDDQNYRRPATDQ